MSQNVRAKEQVRTQSEIGDAPPALTTPQWQLCHSHRAWRRESSEQKVQRRDCDSCFSGTTSSRSLSGIEIRENASLLTPVSVVRLEAVGKT